MKIVILDRDVAARTIQVRFAHQDVIHERAVNTCHDAQGAYDEEATEARIGEVALGVARKIEVGAIVNAPPPLVIAAPAED